MTDKQYREQKARVEKIWDEWYDILAMWWWRIDRTWDRAREENNYDCIAKTSSNWQYRTAHITFYLPTALDLDDSHLEESIVHEFVHVLLAPIQDMRDDQAREITEHTVTTVARTLIWAKEAGQKNGKSKDRA